MGVAPSEALSETDIGSSHTYCVRDRDLATTVVVGQPFSSLHVATQEGQADLGNRDFRQQDGVAVSRTTRTQGEDTGVEEMKHGSSERGTPAKWWTVHGQDREDRVAIIRHDNATTLKMDLKMWINGDLRVTKQGGDDRRQGGWRVVDEQQSKKGGWHQQVMVDTGAEISLMSASVAEGLGWTWMPVPATFPVRVTDFQQGSYTDILGVLPVAVQVHGRRLTHLLCVLDYDVQSMPGVILGWDFVRPNGLLIVPGRGGTYRLAWMPKQHWDDLWDSPGHSGEAAVVGSINEN